MNPKQFNLDEFIAELTERFPDFIFHLDRQGAGWARVFVHVSQGENEPELSLGRINFQPCKENTSCHHVFGCRMYGNGIGPKYLPFVAVKYFSVTGEFPDLSCLIKEGDTGYSRSRFQRELEIILADNHKAYRTKFNIPDLVVKETTNKPMPAEEQLKIAKAALKEILANPTSEQGCYFTNQEKWGIAKRALDKMEGK